MATEKIPITISQLHPMIPVTITNPKSKKSVTINMIIDTGWDMNQVTPQYAAALGYNAATDAVLKKPNEKNVHSPSKDWEEFETNTNNAQYSYNRWS